VADNENPLADPPLSKLLMELLIKIFHHTRTGHSVLDDYTTNHPNPVVLALGHVCSHWRNVVLGAPTLWANIRIVKYDTEAIREAARLCLEEPVQRLFSHDPWAIHRDNSP